MFDDEEQLEYCMGVAEEAKELLDQKLEEKRKQAKKEGKTSVEEDDPIKGGCLCEMECFTTHSSYFRYSRHDPARVSSQPFRVVFKKLK